jgi:hypothetical protein
MPRGSLPQKGVGSARDIPWASSQLVVVDESAGVSANDIVYIKGRSNSFPTVALADATDAAKSLVPLYVCRHGASDGQKVEIVPWKLISADTSSYSASASLYLDASGGLSATRADGAVRLAPVATALDSATSGRIQIAPNSPASLGEAIVVPFDVVYSDDTGSGTEVTLFTVPTGQAYIVDAAFVEITTTFDGGSASLTLGTDGSTANDPDGIIAAADIDVTTAAYDALGQDEKGAQLWDDTEDAVDILVVPAADKITATVTKGTSATQGAATFYVRLTRIK